MSSFRCLISASMASLEDSSGACVSVFASMGGSSRFVASLQSEEELNGPNKIGLIIVMMKVTILLLIIRIILMIPIKILVIILLIRTVTKIDIKPTSVCVNCKLIDICQNEVKALLSSAPTSSELEPQAHPGSNQDRAPNCLCGT